MVLSVWLLGASCAVFAATPEEVDKAIKRGVENLYTQQNEQGNWESTPSPGQNARKEQADPKSGQWGGFSSLATYALLDSGESWSDKRVGKACEWLNKAPMIGTYAVALRAQIWQYLPQNANVKAAAQRDCGMLLSGMKARGDARGMWAYFVSDGNSPRYDHSTSQIALLGVWACNQAGRDAPIAFWKESENAWRSHQNQDGGWSYIYKGDGEQGTSKLSMTLAAVASLFIAQDFVHASDGINCKGNVFDDSLVVGTKWIKEHLQEGFAGGYNLYAAERVGIASGFKYFGDFDWYKQAAEKLVRSQGADGSWGSIPETSFAIIVLSRGRAPVILNKFEYDLEGKPPIKIVKAPPKPVEPVKPAPVKPNPNPTAGRPGRQVAPPPVKPEAPKPITPEPEPVDPNATSYAANWCERPRDVALFTRWMSDTTERKLNWQVISNRATVDDFHDAPVLYMSGNQKLVLPKETIDKLRQYIEEGGLLFGQADCGSKEFTDSFIALGKELFPMYEFRELPADHPIFTRQQFLRKNWKSPPSVMGLSNGTRELMITLPGSDIARSWQQGEYKGKEEAFQVMNGIVLYSVDRQNLKYKGGSHVVRVDPAGNGGGRAIKVARLQFAGNWDPEPAGWRRLAAILQKQQQAQVTVETIKFGEGKLDAAVYQIAHLTGTGGFTFTKDQLSEIRKFVIKGGVVVCDAAGGDSEFAASAETQLAQIIAGSKLEPIAADDAALAAGKGGDAGAPMVAPGPVFQPGAATTTQPTTEPSGKSLLPDGPPPATQPAATQAVARAMLPGNFPIEYRSFARARMGTTENLRLKGIKFRKNWAVVFSAEDLATGMVGQQVDGINGYIPACATEIMRRLVLNLAPAVAPAP
jgi:hypothetical protein